MAETSRTRQLIVKRKDQKLQEITDLCDQITDLMLSVKFVSSGDRLISFTDKEKKCTCTYFAYISPSTYSMGGELRFPYVHGQTAKKYIFSMPFYKDTKLSDDFYTKVDIFTEKFKPLGYKIILGTYGFIQ